MLLALAISGLIGAGVVMMLAAMSNATQAQHDVRRSSVKRQVAAGRIGPLLRDARSVLGYDTDHVVLWTGDVNNNAKPDLSELRRVEWNDGNEVWAFAAPDGLSAGSDTTYDLTDDFSAVTAALAGSANFPGRLTLRGVTDFHLSLDQTDAAAARAIRLQVTIVGENAPDISVIIAALRATSS